MFSCLALLKASFSLGLFYPVPAKPQTEATPAQEDNATNKKFCPAENKPCKWVTLFLTHTCWKPQIIGDSCGWTVVLFVFPAGICNKYLRMGSGHRVWRQSWIMSHIHHVPIPDWEHTLLQDSNLKPAFKALDFTHCMLRSFTTTSDLHPTLSQATQMLRSTILVWLIGYRAAKLLSLIPELNFTKLQGSLNPFSVSQDTFRCLSGHL